MKVPASSAIPGTVEAQFAKRLAGNEKKIRDRAFKKLKLYLLAKSEKSDGGLSRDEMLRLWKGLFYCVWMSDKPLIQEELAKSISEILPMLKNVKTSFLYFETFLTTISREWRGIDRLRMDKFYLLTRFMLNEGFICLKNNSWEEGIVDWFLSILKNGPISPTAPTPNKSSGPPLGVRLHILDIYIEELTACGHDCLTSEQVTKFIMPFCILICNTPVTSLRNKTNIRIFQEVVDQSDVVRKAVAEASGEMLLPENTLNYDHAAIADALFELINKKKARPRNRKVVYRIVQKLREVAEGRLPLDDVPDLPDDVIGEMKMAEEELTARLDKEKLNEFNERINRKRRLKRMRKGKTQSISEDLIFNGQPKVDNEEKLSEDKDKDVENNLDETPTKKAKKRSRKRKTGKKVASVEESNGISEEPFADSSTPRPKKKAKTATPHIDISIPVKSPLTEDNEQFAKFTSPAPQAAFLRTAASKVAKRMKTPKKTPTKIIETPVKAASAKKVSFQMSKTQVKPFKKNERSSVLSPSPLTVAFDPNKTPDFGLLKRKKVIKQVSRSLPKKKRPTIADLL